MKKSESHIGGSEMRPEYDFKKGIRGKYAKAYTKGTNVIVLDPDIAKVFPDSKAVNEALRILVRVASKRASKSHPSVSPPVRRKAG